MREDRGSDTLYWEEGPARVAIISSFDTRLENPQPEKQSRP